MSFYTKKGDKGETKIFSGKRISKDSSQMEAIGTVDELNSYLGVVVSNSEDRKLKAILIDIQKDLLTTGSILGGGNLRFFASKTNKLEKIIDEVEKELPELKHFIIPGGSKVALQLHFARAICRRTERVLVRLNKKEVSAKGRSSSGRKAQILAYLNRLSDLLFTLARYENFKLNIEEKEWAKH